MLKPTLKFTYVLSPAGHCEAAITMHLIVEKFACVCASPIAKNQLALTLPLSIYETATIVVTITRCVLSVSMKLAKLIELALINF